MNKYLLGVFILVLVGGAAFFAYENYYPQSKGLSDYTKSTVPTPAAKPVPSPTPHEQPAQPVSESATYPKPVSTSVSSLNNSNWDVVIDNKDQEICDGSSQQKLVHAIKDAQGNWATTTIALLGPSGVEVGPVYYLLSSPVEYGLVFLISVPCATEGLGGTIHSYKLSTGEMRRLSFSFSFGDPISPDGTKIVSISGEWPPGSSSLILGDLLRDSTSTVATIPKGESFEFGCDGWAGCATSSLHWVNNSTIEYNVYGSTQTPLETHRISVP